MKLINLSNFSATLGKSFWNCQHRYKCAVLIAMQYIENSNKKFKVATFETI